MSMPKGDSPQTAQDYYQYLQAHHIVDGRTETWNVDWFALAWLWGFLAVMVVALLLWVSQYRTTRQKTGLYPIDRFGGWTSEAAGPATFFFLLLTAILTGFAVVLVVGHIVSGQRF